VPDLSWLLWLFILAQFFVPLYQKQMLELRRKTEQADPVERLGVDMADRPSRARTRCSLPPPA
jgi:hypothetical protein